MNRFKNVTADNLLHMSRILRLSARAFACVVQVRAPRDSMHNPSLEVTEGSCRRRSRWVRQYRLRWSEVVTPKDGNCDSRFYLDRLSSVWHFPALRTSASTLCTMEKTPSKTDIYRNMGAKAGESCSFCGTKMNQGSTICAGCGAQRKEGVQGEDIFFAVMGGLGLGFLIAFGLFFLLVLSIGEIPSALGILFLIAFLIPPVITVKKAMEEKEDQVLYVRRKE